VSATRVILLIAAALTLGLGACASRVPRPAPAAQTSALDAADISPGRKTPRQDIVALATTMLGQPYRYGGAAPGGFDCSGLVAYAAAGAGVRVPRTASEQYAQSSPVHGGPQQGDLIFMHLARKELHVGIFVGEGKFIHAPSSGGRVRIDSLRAAPYARGFIGARRIVPY
jgi:cell wall-associated NlpC family hydrolase